MKKFNININYIKRLEIIEDSDYIHYFKNYDYLFKNFLFLDIFKNNLLYLNLYSNIGPTQLDIFDNINYFKSLRILKLKNFQFPVIFTINIPSLKRIKLVDCENIHFPKNVCINLIKITVIDSKTISFDYNNLSQLKYLNINIYEFINYINSPIEKLKLKNSFHFEKSEKEIEKQIFTKILSLNSLKKIIIELGFINAYISEIQGFNYSITNAKFKIMDYQHSDFFYIQDKFPNLTTFEIEEISFRANNLSIKENIKSKIDEFSVKFGKSVLYCCPFEKLISVEFEINDEANINRAFPIFNYNCKIIFHSLTHFKFRKKGDISLGLFNIIFNNINKMPKLKYFYLSCFVNGVEEMDYLTCCKKLLHLNLDSIYLHINNQGKENIEEEYSDKFLKTLCPNIKIIKLDSIHIQKLNKSNCNIF